MDFETLPEPQVLLVDDIKAIRSVLGSETAEADILRALAVAGNNPGRAINILLDAQWTLFDCKPLEGVNIRFESRSFNDECASHVSDSASKALTAESADHKQLQFKSKPLSKNAVFQPCKSAASCLDYINTGVKKDEIDVIPAIKNEEPVTGSYKGPILGPPDFKIKNKPATCLEEDRFAIDKEEKLHIDLNRADDLKEMNEDFEESSDNFSMLAAAHYSPHLNHRPIRALSPKPVTERNKLAVLSKPELAELAEFQEEPDWFLVGRSYVMALSTTRGWGKLEANEIVYFNFPKVCGVKSYGKLRFSLKAAAATSEIVRFSTKRSGEIGRLPPEWSRCLIPLVQSSKVKVRGRCALTPFELGLMTEVTLYVSFYIHGSVFTKLGTTWKLESPPQLSSSLRPLHSLFCLLKIKPLKEAEFTPEELESRKRSLCFGDKDNESEQIEGLAKRRKGETTYIEQSNDEQAISEAVLNKLVGTSVPYNLQEAKPPSTLVSNLWPYQKQALHWMTGLEKGIDVEEAAKTLDPCWSAYNICDKRAPTVYVNVFTGEATTKFPCATQMARGGILADAVGLGKTVMTIALILANPSKGKPDEEDAQTQILNESERALKRGSSRLDGGTLIVCPMALLGQWKDEIEAHSFLGSLSIFIHYGGDKSNDAGEISKYDVVLTTYGALTSAYKTGLNKKSIFHIIRWYRVVLDEAHTIKCSKTIVAQSTFALASYYKWCLTGTPLQNNLEDLYSLLCFLNVQPWSNWSWWYKLIQRPYEHGEERGLRLVKAILRPLMLRRTKETKDKEGKPIIVLPPVHVDVVVCQQSEEERDFYDALFWKSKIKFDQFVAQGKVLNNYAFILELLLRLRQCCNHPFLVMSLGDNQNCADLNDLARRFLECSHNNPGGSSQCAAPAYVEEVVEGIKRGEVSECPICLESESDDPVFTPCAHRMCRECLLASWKTPTSGTCPICRRALTKADLITCPIESRFQVSMHKNWKESAKIRELITCLKKIRRSCPGEKSIVFSQWTSFLDLLEICFRKEGIQFLRFDGKLSQKGRELVLKEFSESLNNEVLLMSLKAGGVGLNLTVASNVFLMDPWWNPAVEEQAIMRIHRIGQKRQVQVRRFIVQDTVEDRMQQVQARKQRMIAGALTDKEVRTARIEELKMLFR